MIELDGSAGEGGGQILRTALTLSMITGQPFRIVRIRANRERPGLLRQHLVAVQAATQVCGAEVAGATLGATVLEFAPGKVRGGEYDFSIGTAGSCTLVLQTLLPALLHADTSSKVHVRGGTHNPLAPPAQFLQRAYGRVLATMGAQVELSLERFGFYPAGGGAVRAHVAPCRQWKAVDLAQRGELRAGWAESFVARVPEDVARRELDCVERALGWGAQQLRAQILPNDQGPGNALLVTLEHQHVTEVFCGFGERGVRAEKVAQQAIDQAQQYLASGAALGEYLTDQVMLPMALAGSGRFSTSCLSQHALTNAGVIGRFMPVRFAFAGEGKFHRCVVSTQ